MKKVLGILILLIMVSCSEKKSENNKVIDSTEVITDTIIVDSISK